MLPRDMVEPLSLEVFKKRLDVAQCQGLVDKVVFGHRLDLRLLKVFSNLVNSVIL